MYLYLCEKTENQKHFTASANSTGFSESMVRESLRDYGKRQQLGIPDEILREPVIVRTEKGKPFFAGLKTSGAERSQEVFFSVSHSGTLWGCLMASEPVGFDLEVMREKVNYEKIARRFFTEEECAWILAAGPEAFFDVWVRKEAYVKFLGSGLAEGLNTFSVVENGSLVSVVRPRSDHDGDHISCKVSSLRIREGAKAAYCSISGEPVKAILTLTR